MTENQLWVTSDDVLPSDVSDARMGHAKRATKGPALTPLPPLCPNITVHES